MEALLVVLGALATVLPVLVKIWNNRVDAHAAAAPARKDEETDYAFQSNDPAAHGAELQSLDDRLRRAEINTGLARQPSPDP